MGYDINQYPSAYKNYAAEISLPIYPQLNHEACIYVVQQVIQSVQSVLSK